MKILLTSVLFSLIFSGAASGELNARDQAGEAQMPGHAPSEIIVKFREGADPIAVLQSANIQVNSIERVFSIKSVVTKFREDHKRGSEIPDEQIFKEAYEKMPELEKTLYRSYKIKLAGGVSVGSAIGKLKKDPDVEYAEPNYKMRTLAGPQ